MSSVFSMQAIEYVDEMNPYYGYFIYECPMSIVHCPVSKCTSFNLVDLTIFPILVMKLDEMRFMDLNISVSLFCIIILSIFSHSSSVVALHIALPFNFFLFFFADVYAIWNNVRF